MNDRIHRRDGFQSTRPAAPRARRCRSILGRLGAGRYLSGVLLAAMAGGSAAAQDWSVEVLDPSSIDPETTGAVVPAAELPRASGTPQDLGLFPMLGAAEPPAGSMAQYYVFVSGGETLAQWPLSAQGRVALVKPQLPTFTFAQIANNGVLAGAVAVMLIDDTTNPSAVSSSIPAAVILPAQGELLVDLIDGTMDAVDPPNGAVSRHPVRLNPTFTVVCEPVAVPETVVAGAYRGTRVPPGTTPDFDGNPNTLAPYEGPALEAAIFPVGREAAEPTLGVLKNGTAFYAAATFDAPGGVLPRTVGMRSRDGGASWEGVSPPLPEPFQSEPPVNGDPMVYVEPDSGRVFSLDTYDADCMWLIFSDDEGESWSRNPVVCDLGSVTDHQTIFAGPPTPELEPLVDLLFGKVLYTCINTVASTNCLRSLDGGLTFARIGTAYTGFEAENLDAPFPHFGVPGLCGGLTAHLQTDSEGRVFLPAGRCGLPAISISEDAGMTWERVPVNGDVPLPGVAGVPDGDNEHENTTAVDAADNLYMTWWDHNDHLPYLAVSLDHGRTWSDPLMIAPPGVQEVNFPTIDAGDPGRIVIQFPGSVVGDRADETRPWNTYTIVSTNALDEDPLFVFTVANDPAQPIHRGDCTGRCGGMFDFLDVLVPPGEVPAQAQGFWAAAVDTCDANCEQCATAADGMDGIVVRQLAGPALHAQPIVIEDTDPAIEYQGGWHLRQAADASAGTYHRRVGPKNGGIGANPTARLVFEGDAITYRYATASGGGTADVLIDGALVQTVSYAGSGADPSFGAEATFDELGDGTHEIRVEYRSGIAFLDGFEIAPASGPAETDESAPLARSVTQLTAATFNGALPGATATVTTPIDAVTEEISVVVEGASAPLIVRLLGPLGQLLASGGALLDGFAASGLDGLPAGAGSYTVKVINPLPGGGTVEVSVARTVRE